MNRFELIVFDFARELNMFHRLNKAFGRSLKKTRPPSAEAPDDEFCSYSEHNQNMPQDFEMEFDIPRGLAGKVIGHKGTTCSRIKNVSGANVYVAIPERDDGRTYVEVTGDCEQVLSFVFKPNLPL